MFASPCLCDAFGMRVSKFVCVQKIKHADNLNANESLHVKEKW